MHGQCSPTTVVIPVSELAIEPENGTIKQNIKMNSEYNVIVILDKIVTITLTTIINERKILTMLYERGVQI